MLSWAFVFESRIDPFQCRNNTLLDCEVVTHKAIQLVPAASLNLVPILIVITLLYCRLQIHQHEVPDFVGFCQVKAGGVQAFENELGIIAVLRLQFNVNDFKANDSMEQLLDSEFFICDDSIVKNGS